MKKASIQFEAFFISYKTVVLTHLLVNFLLIHLLPDYPYDYFR